MTDESMAPPRSPRLRMGISACLLGEKVRYDGTDRLDRYIRDTLGRFVDLIPVCPEVESGLPVPRDPMHLMGTRQMPRLIVTRTGKDITKPFTSWVSKKINQLRDEDLDGFIFKARSPSCGPRRVKIFHREGKGHCCGMGLFAMAYHEHYPFTPSIDDEAFHCLPTRASFIQRLFVAKRWRRIISSIHSRNELARFHADHRLIIMAHDPPAVSSLDRIMERAQAASPSQSLVEYWQILDRSLELESTRIKKTRVFRHVVKTLLMKAPPEDLSELERLIEKYRQDLLPWIVPFSVMRHLLRRHSRYAEGHPFFDPDPTLLALLNHP